MVRRLGSLWMKMITIVQQTGNQFISNHLVSISINISKSGGPTHTVTDNGEVAVRAFITVHRPINYLGNHLPFLPPHPLEPSLSLVQTIFFHASSNNISNKRARTSAIGYANWCRKGRRILDLVNGGVKEIATEHHPISCRKTRLTPSLYVVRMVMYSI